MYWFGLNLVFGIGKDTIVTIVVTCLIFLLGLLFQVIWHYFLAFLQRRRIRKAFYVILREFIQETRHQSQNLLQNSKQFDLANRKEFNLVQNNITSTRMFQEIGFKLIYEAHFVGLENILNSTIKVDYHKKFILLIKNIHDADYWHEKWQNEVVSDLVKYNEINNKRNDAIDAFRKKMDRISQEVNEKTFDRRSGLYLQKLDDICAKWQTQVDPTAPSVVNEELVVKVLEHNRSHPNIRLTLVLNDDLLELSIEYTNLSNLLDKMRLQAEHYATTFEKFALSGAEFERIN